MQAAVSSGLVFLLFLASCAVTVGERESEIELERERDSERGPYPAGMLQRAQARRLADGTVPHDALMRAASQQRAMTMLDDFAAPLQWSWLGPGNVGGRVRSILPHPTNPNRLWIGAAGGGVWRSDDAGLTWQPMNGILTMLGCGCMALDPANPDHLWFGSGEGYFDAVAGSSNTAILRGAGLFESTDAGVTWARLPATATPDWYFVNRLAIDPNNSQNLLAATGSGIWRTTDGGQTWSRRTTERALDVDFHPTDSTRAVAGRTDGRALWSIDGGVTWTAVQVSAAATRIELAYSRSSPQTVYCTASDTGWFIHVFRSIDGGQTWVQRSTGSIATYSLYNNCLWVDPTNGNNLIYGGVQLYVSADGGASRSQSTNGAHPDYHFVVEAAGFNGSTNRRVWVGDDGGVHTRADWQTGTWSSRNTGLGITQFYGAAMNANGVMLAGAQDNGTSRFTGDPMNWNYNVIGGDGGFCAADQQNSNYLYGGFQYFGINRSSNGGGTWSSIQGATSGDPGFNFMPYFLLDPNDQNRMLSCGRALWRTNNVRTGTPPTWTQIKAPRSCAADDPPYAHFQDNPPCNLSTAQIAVGNSDIVWVGHNDGEVYRTANGTSVSPSWTLIDSALGQLPDRWVSSIAIDPTNTNHVLISFMGYAADSIWETWNNGVTWATATGSGTGALPALPVSWVLIHPRLTSCWFAATDLGLFYTTSGGLAWSPVTGGPEYTCIDQLVWKNDRQLLCVTHGRGIWLADLPLASAQPLGPGCAVGAPAQLASSPPVVGSTVSFTMTGGRATALVFFALSFGPPAGQVFGSCIVEVDLPNTSPFVAGFTDGVGSWALNMGIPAASNLIGSPIVTQAFLVGLGGPMLGVGDLSNAVQLVLGL